MRGVVDWYDFLLYGITAALVFNREFSPGQPRDGPSPRLPPSASVFCFARWAG
jgi:MHS family shikimate/dehydroshikimate transporter-like MFS transporter